jgi:uncharacterized protein YndB with AHSA1/START domain
MLHEWQEVPSMIRRQIVMPVTPERLWQALTDPVYVAGWFGARVEWRLEEGSPARFLADDGEARSGRVEAVRPGRHLRFTWWPSPQTGREGTNPGPGPGPGAGDGSGAGEGASEVSYVLEPVPEGTRLTIQERQIVPAGPSLVSRTSAEVTGGWTRWDGRLMSAWGGLTARSLQGVRA